jgi:hypothetical protein
MVVLRKKLESGGEHDPSAKSPADQTLVYVEDLMSNILDRLVDGQDLKREIHAPLTG